VLSTSSVTPPLAATGAKVVPAVYSITSAMTLTAALWKQQRTLVDIRPFESAAYAARVISSFLREEAH